MDAALGVGAEVQLIPGFHGAGSERTVNLILEKLQRHLGSNDLDLWIEVDEVSDQAGMIRFGVAHDQNIDAAGIDLVLQQGDPGVTELGMAGVDQRSLFSSHQKGVVGGAVAQAKFDVEAASIPVKGANGGGVRSNRFALQRKLGSSRGDDHDTTVTDVDFKEIHLVKSAHWCQPQPS